MRITEQLGNLQGRIRAAADQAGRDPKSIGILAVSKKRPPEAVQEAIEAGLRDFGENYVQEALTKIPAIGDDAIWHFIGRIQSNKTRPIAEHFSWVHTITDRRTVERLSQQRPDSLGALQVCIQLRPTGATEREGIEAGDLSELATVISELPRLRLRGLMMMPLPGKTAITTRQEYSRTHELLDELRRSGHDVDTLSMGMSSDLEAAVWEGSTLLRIGTALFGPRDE
jgi:pyridoxal phosphate enzyme (YggS family)